MATPSLKRRSDGRIGVGRDYRDRAVGSAHALNRATDPIDRDLVWTTKKSALEVIFAAPRSAYRQARYESFKSAEGKGLEDFALWSAIKEIHPEEVWPDELLDITGPAVTALRERLGDRIEFFSWLQWVADEQLAAAQRV